MATVTFNLSQFRTRYPEFAGLDVTLLNAYFSEASLYCNNTDFSVVDDVNVRSLILNMLVAHIAELQTIDLVGRIGDVTIGGVPAHMAYAQPSGSRAWYDQTKYGAQAWQAMSPYRRFRYVLPCGDSSNPSTPSINLSMQWNG